MLLHYNQNLTFSEFFHLWSLLIHGWRYLRWLSLVSCWRLWIGFVVIVCFTLTLRASSVSNQSDGYVSITRIFITITYDQNTFWAILFCTVGASAVSDDPLFTFSLWMWGFFFFFFLLNTHSSCKTVPGIRLERSSSWGDRQALISVACPDGVEGDRRQIAEVSPKT